MKMIAFYNNKGGVGKTSTAINIAYTLSRRQNRILLVDFDGQCNSSRFFTDLANDECGCESAIVNAEEMPLIKSTRYDNIDIVTSSVRMNSISNYFANLSDEEKQTNIIKFRQSDYDYIIVDMPPAMNDFTEHVLTVCDYVYVPIELGTFAVQGLARVTQKIANAGTKYACFASKYDKANKADRELLEIMKKNLGDKVLNTVVPFSRAIKNSISYRITASEYMAWINPARCYEQLANESEQKQESVPDCYYFPATDEQINALTNAKISFEKQTKSDSSVIIRVGIDDKEKAETIMNTKKVVL